MMDARVLGTREPRLSDPSKHICPHGSNGREYWKPELPKQKPRTDVSLDRASPLAQGYCWLPCPRHWHFMGEGDSALLNI